jgi:hypothetical protein
VGWSVPGTHQEDHKRVDCFGVIRREALAPIGMDKDFGNQASPDMQIPAGYLLVNLERAAIILHEKDPNLLLVGGQREIDLVNFQLLSNTPGAEGAITKTICDMRDAQKFSDVLLGFLTDGRRPLILTGI